MRPSAEIHFKLPFSLRSEDGWVLSHCPVLDVTSQGEDELSAKKNLIEAIQLFIETCIESGSIDSVLADCGFTRNAESASESEQDLANEGADTNYLNVPVNLLIQAQNNGSIAIR